MHISAARKNVEFMGRFANNCCVIRRSTPSLMRRRFTTLSKASSGRQRKRRQRMEFDFPDLCLDESIYELQS